VGPRKVSGSQKKKKKNEKELQSWIFMVIAVITSNTERIEFRDSYELKGKHLMH
jgi:hypothetical protein